MTNQQANTTIQLLRDIYARLQVLITTNQASATSIQQSVNQVDTDVLSFASLYDNWSIIMRDWSWIVVYILFGIFTLLAIKTFRDR